MCVCVCVCVCLLTYVYNTPRDVYVRPVRRARVSINTHYIRSAPPNIFKTCLSLVAVCNIS